MHLWKCDHVAQGRSAQHLHNQPVQANTHAAVRRRAILKRVGQKTKLFVSFFLAETQLSFEKKDNPYFDRNQVVLSVEKLNYKNLVRDVSFELHQGEILGFTLGAPLTETIFDVHFERARGEVQGAYPAVNRSFAQYVRQRHLQVRYLDREDDMGLPGLRKAKLSYYPDYLQVNYCAVETRAPR